MYIIYLGKLDPERSDECIYLFYFTMMFVFIFCACVQDKNS